MAHGWMDAEAQREVALQHNLCPYYLGQELVRWADVMVGDVHHYFDAHGQLWGLMQALEWKLAILVDEAHNLLKRARQMYTAELRLSELEAAASAAPAAVRASLHGLAEAATQLSHAAAAPYAVLQPVPDAFTQALQAATGALAEHFQQHPLAVGGLLNFHFALQRFVRLVDAFSDHALFDVQTAEPAPNEADHALIASGPAEVVLGVRNVAPAPFLRQRLKQLQSLTLFSATLAAPACAVALLGLPDNTAWIDVPSAFPPEHLTVQIADEISARLADRERSLRPLVHTIAAQFEAHPGNYLAFFSSFDSLDKAADRLALQRPDIPQWRQTRRMSAPAREAFIERFQPLGRGVGFAVLGGVFAEGVDLPGSLLIGAFIATLGLPPVSEQQTHLQARLGQLLGQLPGPDPAQGEWVPALQKVVQAAGRVLRTPQDRGWLWLMDDRYRRREVLQLLQRWWHLN